MATNIEQIQQLYIALYGRPADPAGQAYWGSILATDPNAIPTIAATFAQSSEYAANFSGKSSAAIVTSLYQNMYGHAPSAGQVTEWSAKLDQGTNIGTVLTGIIGSSSAADLAILNFKVTAATSFTAAVNTQAEINAYGTDAGKIAVKEYLASVDDAASLNVATTPYSLGLVTAESVAGVHWSAPERVDQQVQELYVAYFSRAADDPGHTYWTALLDGDPNNPRLQLMSSGFAASKEYRDEYSQATNELKVAAVYDNLFGRTAEAAGVKFWADAMNAGHITIDNVVTAIATGAQGSDKFAYGAKVDVAQAITLRIDTPQEAAAYSGTNANAAVANYIAQVKDQASFNAAITPASIDALIASLSGPSAVAPDADVQLVGMAAAEPTVIF